MSVCYGKARIAPLADVKARLRAYVDECEVDGPILITSHGKAVAVLLVPNDDDDLERILLGRSPRLQAMLPRSRRSVKEGEGLSEKDFWKPVRKPAQRERLRPPIVEGDWIHLVRLTLAEVLGVRPEEQWTRLWRSVGGQLDGRRPDAAEVDYDRNWRRRPGKNESPGLRLANPTDARLQRLEQRMFRVL